MRLRWSLVLCSIALLACADRGASDRSGATPDGESRFLKLESIVAGNMFTCGRDAAGAIWCWGANDYGQLGVGDRVDRTAPVRVALSTPAVRLTAGEARMCAVDSLSTLRCWGDNVAYALADSVIQFRAEPAVVSVGPVRVVAAGSRFSCATDEAGEARCWGGDREGELGDGGDSGGARATSERVVGAMRFDTLVAGRTHACGLTAEGDAWCWGSRALSGDGSKEQRNAPVPVDGGHRFVSLTAGLSVTCGITVAGDAWCWGFGHDGQLGIGAGRDNPFVPVAVAGGLRFRQLAAGFHRVCGIAEDRRAWCWGSNFNGALGDSGTVSTLSPVPVHGDRRYRAIAAGDSHVCALDMDSLAWCWGQNVITEGGGALGDGTKLDRSYPVRVIPPEPASASANAGPSGN
jgi:alpha-tubulin suppressor-like RCC1 family protein